MAPDEVIGRRLHCRDIEGRLHQPGPAALDRERRAAIDDAVEIGALARREAGMKTHVDGFRPQNGHRVGLHMEIECVAHRLAIGGFVEVDMGDLAERMHAGIGAASDVGDHPLAAEAEDGALEHFLDGEPVALTLPANEAAPVILDHELVARHPSTVPAGTGRPRRKVSASRGRPPARCTRRS